MHVKGVETSAVEGKAGLDVAVDPLLAQDGDLRPRPQQRRRMRVVGRVEREVDVQPRVLGQVAADARVFFVGSLGVIP